MGLNHDLVGKQYPAQDYGVTAEAIRKYVQAYNEGNPVFCDPERAGGIIAPPMFGVVIGWLPIMLVMTDTDLHVDVLQLLHSEQDMKFFLPVVPGNIISCIATIQHIEEKAGGESLAVEVQGTNQRGELVQTTIFTAFIRSNVNVGKRQRGKSHDAFSPTPKEEPLLRIAQSIDTDQTYRYAEASGDHNPIHVDENVAKMAGMPGIIVHGLCTMAFTSKVMIDHLCDHDPRRLQRLRVRFARPVFPGQEITTAVWKKLDQSEHNEQIGIAGIESYTYETYNPDGKAVIKDGIAEIRSA